MYIYIYYYEQDKYTFSFHEIDEMYLSQYEQFYLNIFNKYYLLEQCLTAILLQNYLYNYLREKEPDFDFPINNQTILNFENFLQ